MEEYAEEMMKARLKDVTGYTFLASKIGDIVNVSPNGIGYDAELLFDYGLGSELKWAYVSNKELETLENNIEKCDSRAQLPYGQYVQIVDSLAKELNSLPDFDYLKSNLLN